MRIKKSTAIYALVLSSMLATSVNAGPQEVRKASVKKLIEHGVELSHKANLTATDKQHVKELANQGLLNYKMLDANAFDALGIEFIDGKAKPILLDSFTGEDLSLKPCANGPTCGIPAINPVPGTPNYENELLVKKAIELASSSDKPIRVRQTVNHNGENKEVDVDYFVMVKALHPGSICYTTYYAGYARQTCYPR